MNENAWLDERLAQRARGDGEVLAWVPEPDVRGRLKTAAAQLPPAGALLGLGVAVKDIFAATGTDTRAGSALDATLFAERIGSDDGTAVARLRAAGAVVLGKSVTAEFACLEPNATRNPRNLDHTPGGSSSGSAAAVAAGAAELALGTQTVGSVIRPAAYCRVMGFKPTYGRIPIDGVLHFSPSVDHVGVFAADLDLLGRALAVLVDDWSPARAITTPRLLVPVGAYLNQTEAAARDRFERTLAALERAGVQLRRVVALDDADAIVACHSDLIAREFALQHADWYRDYGALYRPVSADFARRGLTLDDGAIERGQASCAALRKRLDATLAAHDAHAWITPAATGPAPIGHRSTGSPVMSTPWTHAGVPAISVPAGAIEAPGGALPLGVQLAGASGADEPLLALAKTLAPLLQDTPSA